MAFVPPNVFYLLKEEISVEIAMFNRKISNLNYCIKKDIDYYRLKVKQEEKRIEKEILAKNIKLTEAEVDEIRCILYHKFPEVDFYEDFIQITSYYSIVIELYTFLERKINDIYSEINRKQKIEIKKERGTNTISKFRKNLEKNLSLNFNCLKYYESEFVFFNDIRNQIVHYFGILEKLFYSDEKKEKKIESLKNRINKSNSIFIENNKIVFKNIDFISGALKLIDDTLNCVLDTLIDYYHY